MKKSEKQSRIIARLKLQLAILEKQRELWTLRALAKKGRIADVQREIAERTQKRR